MLTDDELYAIIVIAINDLGWQDEDLYTKVIQLPSDNYYAIALDWFDGINVGATVADITETLEAAKNKNEDFVLFIDNLSALHRRRVK